MKRLLLCVLLAPTSACGNKTSDTCAQLFDRMASVMKDMPIPAGKSIGEAKDKFLGECRKNPDKVLKDPVAKCMVEAKSDAAAAECMKGGMKTYANSSKAAEAAANLNAIARRAKTTFVETGAYPTGTAKTLPADNGSTGCCGGDGKCAQSTEWASDPVWKALDFEVSTASYYRYSYGSVDGKSFTATAVGDVDCDGKTATFTLTGAHGADGSPTTELAKPEAGAY